MVNRQKVEAGTFQSIHETILTEYDLSHDWIIQFWDYPSRLRELGDALDSLKDVYDEKAGVLRRVSGDEFDD